MSYPNHNDSEDRDHLARVLMRSNSYQPDMLQLLSDESGIPLRQLAPMSTVELEAISWLLRSSNQNRRASSMVRLYLQSNPDLVERMSRRRVENRRTGRYQSDEEDSADDFEHPGPLPPPSTANRPTHNPNPFYSGFRPFEANGRTTSDIPQDNPCSICLNSIEASLHNHVSLACSHRYHLECWNQWARECFQVQRPISCPLCRSRNLANLRRGP